MIIEKDKVSPPPRKRQNKSHTVIERESFYDEQGYIFRTDAGGKFWSVSFWIPEEKKEYRKSLRTKDKGVALQKAKDEFLTVQGKIKNGTRIWDIRIDDLISEYLAFQNQEAEAGKKTLGRVKTIESQLKHLQNFLGSNLYLNVIRDDSFVDYVAFRKKHYPSVSSDTLANEKSTFLNLLKFAQKKNYLPKDREWEFGKIKKSTSRRPMIEMDDYRKMYRYMRGWGSKEIDPNTKNHKEFVRRFILILANTGIRFGEARRLRWRDVEITKTKDGTELIRIDLKGNQTKTGKPRLVVGRAGVHLKALKKHSKWTSPDDLLFVDNLTGQELPKKIYYRLWEELLEGTGLDQRNPPYTYYGLRHSYATWRLAAGISVFDLSRVMGCNVQYIQDHYGHTDIDKMTTYLTKDMIYDEDGKIIWGGV